MDLFSLLPTYIIAIVACTSLIVAVYVIFINWSERARSKDMDRRVLEIERLLDKHYLNGKEIEAVLSDHKRFLDGLLLLVLYCKKITLHSIINTED